MSDLAKRLAESNYFEWREPMRQLLWAPEFDDHLSRKGRVDDYKLMSGLWDYRRCNGALLVPDLDDPATRGVLWDILCQGLDLGTWGVWGAAELYSGGQVILNLRPQEPNSRGWFDWREASFESIAKTLLYAWGRLSSSG